MKIKWKKLIAIATLTLISLILVKYVFSGSGERMTVTLAGTRVNGPRPIPNSIATCLPKNLKSSYLDAVARDGKKTYFSVIWERNVPSEIFEGESEPVQGNSVILEDDLGCQIVIPPELALSRSKTLFLPLPIARELALDKLRWRIAMVGGKEKFQEGLDRSNRENDGGTSRALYFPEDAWAFRQLGLRMPPGSLVRDKFSEDDEDIWKKP
jgi:hypothetical protein